MSENLVELVDINKSFFHVQVLHQVSLGIKMGEVHALIGENGAGKSTLMKILGGIYQKDDGHIYWQGKEIEDMSPNMIKKLGISFVHQELNLAEHLTVAENIFMGRLPMKSRLIVDKVRLERNTSAVLDQLGATFHANDCVKELTIANKQLVEIAKALSQDPKLIIFDEPTTALSDADVEKLFVIIKALRAKGIAIIYISHRLDEIFAICDRATVLRDGRFIATHLIKDLDHDAIIKMMVGRALTNYFAKTKNHIIDNKYLEVNQLSDQDKRVKNVSFHAHQGEVIGFFGLIGAGRTEVMRLLFGADRMKSGDIIINHERVTIRNPEDAIHHGICLLTEDRKDQGLFLGMSIMDNINITHLEHWILEGKAMIRTAKNYVDKLLIKTHSMYNAVRTLSGGNQQKVVLAKWLNLDLNVIIFDEPTKGIDVGARAEFYKIIDQLASERKVVLVVSSDLTEIMGICDRLYVMCEGAITANLSGEEINQEQIMRYATMGGAI